MTPVLPSVPSILHPPAETVRRAPTTLGAGGIAFALAGAIAPTLLLAFAHLREWPGASTGDFAQYVLHAQALLDGRPYTDTGYLFQQSAHAIGPVAYPPGLPVTLVPLLAAGMEPIPALRLIMLISLVAFVAAVVLYFARREPLWVSAAAAGIAGVAIESGRATVLMGSDLGFAALTMFALLLVDRPGPYSWPRVLAVTALGAGAMAYRFPGIALVPAVFVHAFTRPRTERAGQLVVVAIWAAMGLVVFAVAEPLRDNLGSQVARVVGNIDGLPGRVAEYSHIAGAAMLYPFRSAVANDVYHVAGLGLMLVGIVDIVRRYATTALGIFAPAYCLVIMVTPFVESRFFWPVFPVAALALVVGARQVASWTFRSRPRLATTTVQVSLALILVLATVHALRTPPLRSLLGDPDMRSLLAWLQQQPDRPSMRVLFFNPRLLTLESGVPAMGVPSRGPREILQIAERSGLTHIIVGNPSNDVRDAEGPLKDYLASDASGATVEFRNPTFAVYRLPPGS